MGSPNSLFFCVYEIVKTEKIKLRSAINVWDGIDDDHLIASYVFPNLLNGFSHLTFLEEVISESSEETCLRTFISNMAVHHHILQQQQLQNFLTQHLIRGGSVV